MEPNATKGKLVIVEDPFIRTFVRFLLQPRGHTVVEADVKQALDLVRDGEQAVDVLITNVPDRFTAHGELSLIYLAAHPDERLAWPFRRWRILRKPFAPDHLVAAVEGLLGEAAAAC